MSIHKSFNAMRYSIFPDSKPDAEQHVYIIGPRGAEELAIYRGGSRFDICATGRMGYYARYWRPMTDLERRVFVPAPVKRGRGRPKVNK